ncbi:MAG: DUF4230 domain-containing protein [Bacteroidia bacterium]|nr:DUF4230 domain-containing protein [Bacteroidia bacterium]
MKYLLTGILFSLLFGCKPDYSAQEQELVSRLQASSQLATVEMVFTKVVRGTKSSTFYGIPTGHSDFLAETEAHAKAGIDLSKVSVGLIDWETGSIELVLPPPAIISLDIPAESFQVNEEVTKDYYFSELSSEDMDNFYRKAENEVRAELRRMNLEETARQKTESFLRAFLAKSGFKSITFRYQVPPSDS